MASRASSKQGAPDSVWIDAGDFKAILKGVAGFDKKLSAQLRKRIRTAAKPIADDVKRNILQPPPGGGKRSVGTRAALAKGVAIRLSTSARGQGVEVIVKDRFLEAQRKPMLKAYASKSWRHPLFGNREKWVDQEGRHYWAGADHHARSVARVAVQKALDDASEMLAREVTKRGNVT